MRRRILNATRPRAVAAALTCALVALSGCDRADAPAGPPRCEPESELWLERLLKEGYRALSEGRPEDATARFQRVVDMDAKHPEALRALAAASAPQAAEDRAAGAADATDTADHGIAIAGRRFPTAIRIAHGTYDFETLRRLAGLRGARANAGAAPPAHGWYSERAGATPRPDALADSWASAVLSHIDLIVLHDTHTGTAEEAFVNFEYSGASTHFLIDSDGTIYQTLDLALEANHTREIALDGRSVAIDLVNPVNIDLPPGPEGSTPRPLSDFESLQGKAPVQEHGYTDAQLTSLVALTRALCALLPAAPCTLPNTDSTGRYPRRAITGAEGFRGVAGHLHLTPIATDPGAGFSWEAFAQSLK